MKLGIGFPQTEIGTDPIAIRDFVQTAESLGYHYLVALEHVLGPDVSDRPDWAGFLNVNHSIHEPMVLFGFLAACTSTIELVTGILVLPQRQTAIVAKQTAEVDVLSGGRLKLGMGIGYNRIEYEAIGADFATRGRRIEEQIEVLRRLWTEPVVDFTGRWHRIDRAGINPRPVQQPIPVFLGGNSDRALDRAARIADGWLAEMPSARAPSPGIYTPLNRSALPQRLAYLDSALAAAGRNRASFQVRGQLPYAGGDSERWARDLDEYSALGFDGIHVGALDSGLSVAGHMEAIERYMEVARPYAS